MRITLFVAGIVSLLLGILGIFLPLLPTTPFILLAAFLFARSSTRMHQWLLNNPHFGATISQWETSRSIPVQAKKRAMVLIVFTFSITITFFAPSLELKLALGGLALVLLLFMARLKTTAPSTLTQPCATASTADTQQSDSGNRAD